MATLDPWIYNRAAAMAYDNDNIFAKILRGEAPAFRVFEDEFSLAFMDVMPQVPGHTLVIPKDPTQDILNADPIILGHTMSTVQKVAAAVKQAFEAGSCWPNSTVRPPVRPFFTCISIFCQEPRVSICRCTRGVWRILLS